MSTAKALERWQAAQLEYRQECAWHKRFLSELLKGRTVEELSPEELQVMMIGKARRSQASKKRLDEERIYHASLVPHSQSDKIASVLQDIENIREKIMGIKPSEVQLGRASQEYQEMVHNVREQANASPQVRESLETIKKAALARMHGVSIDPLDEGTDDFTIPKRPLNYIDESPVLELVSEIDGEPIDDSLMDTDPDPVPDAVNIAPEAPELLKPPIEPEQSLKQDQPESQEPSRRERVLSNPLWASIAQAASEFVPPPKASPLEQEGNGMPKTYDEYVKEREKQEQLNYLTQANTPQFEPSIETEQNPNPKG